MAVWRGGAGQGDGCVTVSNILGADGIRAIKETSVLCAITGLHACQHEHVFKEQDKAAMSTY